MNGVVDVLRRRGRRRRWWSTGRATRSTAASPRSWCAELRHPAPRLRARRAARGRRARGGGRTASSSGPTSRPWRSTRPPTPSASSASCSAGARGGGGPLRALRRAALALCADCPGRAALCVHEPELTLRAVAAGVPPARSALPSGPRPNLAGHATLLHRATGSDQGRRRERRARGAPSAARRGRAGVGRRDPGRRAPGPLREGGGGARRRRSVDARRVACLARGRPADREQGVPARRVRPVWASTAARRCGSPPASRATTPSRPA